MAVKDNLKRIGKEKGLTQRELAEKSKVSFSMVSKLESGEQLNPSLETIQKLATVLGVEPFQLLTNIDFEKISPIVKQIDEEVTQLLNRPIEKVRVVIHELLLSDYGTEAFEINHNAISPDEMDRIENEILNFIRFQFQQFKDKPSIYNSD